MEEKPIAYLTGAQEGIGYAITINAPDSKEPPVQILAWNSHGGEVDLGLGQEVLEALAEIFRIYNGKRGNYYGEEERLYS